MTRLLSLLRRHASRKNRPWHKRRRTGRKIHRGHIHSSIPLSLPDERIEGWTPSAPEGEQDAIPLVNDEDAMRELEKRESSLSRNFL